MKKDSYQLILVSNLKILNQGWKIELQLLFTKEIQEYSYRNTNPSTSTQSHQATTKLMTFKLDVRVSL